MPLNRDDASKLGYKAQIEWYRERITSLSQGFVNPAAAVSDPDPEKYRNALDDLYKKADKLDLRIDTVSAGLRIPVNKNTDPDVSDAVKSLDEPSGGEYITYELYKSLLQQLNSGVQNLQVEDIIENSSNDIYSNSQLIQDRLYTGYANYSSGSAPKDNSVERYVNRYLNNILSWNEHDYKIRQIINFSDNYLGMFPDPAYEPWTFKQDTLFEKNQITSYKDLWNNFSEIGKSESTRLGGAFKDLVSLRPDQNIAGVTDRYLDYTNKFLNGLDGLFNESWALDLVCCFIKFTKRLDTKTLKGIRALLQLLKSGINFDFQDILGSFKDIFNNLMRGLILNQLMGLINQIIQRMVDPIKKWINNPEDSTWQKIFECTPLRQLIQRYLTDAVDYIQKFFQDILTEIYKDLEMQKISKDSKLFQAKENKWINTALKLVDAVVAVMELSASCATDGTPKAEDVQKIMDQFNIGNEEYIYPIDPKPNIYNSFITEEQQKEIEAKVADGDSSAPSLVTNQMTTVEKAEISRRVDDCKKNIRDVDMPQGIIWLEEIMQNSQGERK